MRCEPVLQHALLSLLGWLVVSNSLNYSNLDEVVTKILEFTSMLHSARQLFSHAVGNGGDESGWGTISQQPSGDDNGALISP